MPLCCRAGRADENIGLKTFTDHMNHEISWKKDGKRMEKDGLSEKHVGISEYA
jgi:hypothetical protein